MIWDPQLQLLGPAENWTCFISEKLWDFFNFFTLFRIDSYFLKKALFVYDDILTYFLEILYNSWRELSNTFIGKNQDGNLTDWEFFWGKILFFNKREKPQFTMDKALIFWDIVLWKVSWIIFSHLKEITIWMFRSFYERIPWKSLVKIQLNLLLLSFFYILILSLISPIPIQEIFLMKKVF